jgi:hypothetical protein
VAQGVEVRAPADLVVPQTTGLIRWRTHLYTLGHALSYFQADFAGRLAATPTCVTRLARRPAKSAWKYDRAWPRV